MKIVGVERYISTDQPNCFVDAAAETPKPTGSDILVKVMAVSVNPVDTKVRSGRGQPADKCDQSP